MLEQPFPIHPETIPGIISLTVTNLKRSLDFYGGVLGLEVHEDQGTAATLGVSTDDGSMVEEIIHLVENPQAELYPHHTGLYHFAILVPDRRELARLLSRLGGANWEPEGYADHLVSESIYLRDPDGIGIEVYRDLPREKWSYRNDQIQMATLPLDVDALLEEIRLDTRDDMRLSAETRLGHVHLKVASIPDSEAFYVGKMGFDLMNRYGSGAEFVSAGGYHHHIGFNTWESASAPPPPAEAIGLRFFSLVFPDDPTLKRRVEILREAGVPVEVYEQGYGVLDPSRNPILLTCEPTYKI